MVWIIIIFQFATQPTLLSTLNQLSLALYSGAVVVVAAAPAAGSGSYRAVTLTKTIHFLHVSSRKRLPELTSCPQSVPPAPQENQK